MQTQSCMILKDLLDGERLSPLDALSKHDCLRLGARIWDLRQALGDRGGHLIRSGKQRTLTGKSVSVYFIEEPDREKVRRKFVELELWRRRL